MPGGMAAKRKKKSTYYTSPRRVSDTPADDQLEFSNTADQADQAEEPDASVSVTPDMLSGAFPQEHQQWVDIGEEMVRGFSNHPEIIPTIRALKQDIRTASTGGSSWKLCDRNHSADEARSIYAECDGEMPGAWSIAASAQLYRMFFTSPIDIVVESVL